MLRGIPSIISPDMMKILMEMGHGDDIVIADRNFPASSCAKRLVRSDGHTIPKLLESILPYFPLDYTVRKPATVMSIPENQTKPEVWDQYLQLIQKHEMGVEDFEYVDRFDFYERSKNAYAIIFTGETALRGNIILKKGVVRISENQLSSYVDITLAGS